MPTFIIDCPRCKAKVGAEHRGHIDRAYFDDEANEPYGERIYIGECPSCSLSVVGRAEQIEFANYEGSGHDVFGDVVRIYPNPPKAFTSYRIPRTLTQSLLEADRSFQAGANIAACVMLGRALEALCRDLLQTPLEKAEPKEGASRPRQQNRNVKSCSATASRICGNAKSSTTAFTIGA